MPVLGLHEINIMSKPTPSSKSELKVFIASRESKCAECGAELGRHAWITLQQPNGAVCLTCADLDHLVYLPSGDAALTRRARKNSGLSAVVLKWRRSRKRYERQGLLVEDQGLEKAEKECQADAEQREIRRAQAFLRREELDQEYISRFAERVRELYPNCPTGREKIIAEHACRKYSGRVGRSAAAKDLAEKAVELAVLAHIRHSETRYDEFLTRGLDRQGARARVTKEVFEISQNWRKKSQGENL